MQPRRRRDGTETTSERQWSPRSRLRDGAVGGAVATVVMTVFRLPISHSLPPTARFWTQYVAGGDPDDHRLAAVALHLGYGVAAGVPFALAVPGLEQSTERTAEMRGAVAGVIYGLVLSAFGVRVVLRGLLGTTLAPDERFVFHLGHVVYGLTLGTWLGSRASE